MKKTALLLIATFLLAGCAALQGRPAPTIPSVVKAGRIDGPPPAPLPDGRSEGAVTELRSQPVIRGTIERKKEPLLPVSMPPPPPSSGEEKYVSLNFDDADISIVIQTIAELIDLNYIVAPGVRGRVTIQSSDKIPVRSLFTVLEEILEVNSLTALKSGSFYKIIPTNQARQKEITVIAEEGKAPPGNPVVTKVVPLTFVRPSEVVKILNPFKSPAGLFLSHDPTRLLFLTDTAGKIDQLMKIVSILDVDTFAHIQVELYPVKYADASDLARELTQVVTMVFSSSGKGRAVLKIIPVVQVNALMVISGEPGLTENILSWIARLDQPPSEATDRIFVYPLAHAKAEEIAAVLNQVFKTEESKKTRNAPVPRAQPQPARQRGAAPPPATAAGAVKQVADTGGESSVTIVADKNTNALIIQTASWYYPVVEETIKKLDIMPKQVLIEVLIAELTLDDNTQYGLQWAAKGQTSSQVGGKTHSFGTQVQNVYSGVGAASAGFSYVLTEAGFISAAINAYANDSKLQILSSPHIMAMDNKEAIINVGAEVPIITTRTTETAGGTSTSSGTVTNDIEYRDTGIILTVTPHINEGRFVTLDIKQEVSQAQANTLGGTSSPIIRKRKAETTMVVQDNQTLVIGGLIDETQNLSQEGMPWLSRIPFLGALFGVSTDTVSKSELILLITPRVVVNSLEGERVSDKLRDRVLTLKKGIGRFLDEPIEKGTK